MSWLYSRALVEAYSEGISLDGEPSVQSNGNPTPQAYLCSDKMMGFSRLSRFGMTFKLLTEDRGEELLMSYLEAFPVKTSPQQEKEQASTESDQECGEKWRGWLAKFDPNTSLLRTAQCSLLEEEPELLQTLPRSGMTRSGMLWERQTLVLRINATESGSWPTPTVCGNYNRKGLSKTSGDGLATAVSKWPTPQASDNRPRATFASTQRRMEKGKQISLEAKVKWTTPTAHMAKETNAPSEHSRNTPTLTAQAGGSLNPTWVEKLMGWPDDWTMLQPISHVKMCFWLMGFCDGEKARKSEVLRMLRQGYAAQEIQREIGRSVDIYKAAILLAELCEHSNRPDEARIFMACAEALKGEVRGVWPCEDATGTPHRPRQDQQRSDEHSDAMQALSRLLAHHGKAYWQDGRWEDAVPRVANGVTARVDRLKAIGNGQVPAVAATAWRILGGSTC